MVYNENEITIARRAFDIARKRREKSYQRGQGQCAGFLPAVEAVVKEVAEEYPDVGLEHAGG